MSISSPKIRKTTKKSSALHLPSYRSKHYVYCKCAFLQQYPMRLADQIQHKEVAMVLAALQPSTNAIIAGSHPSMLSVYQQTIN